MDLLRLIQLFRCWVGRLYRGQVFGLGRQAFRQVRVGVLCFVFVC